jgi:hypothetical protein
MGGPLSACRAFLGGPYFPILRPPNRRDAGSVHDRPAENKPVAVRRSIRVTSRAQ